MDGGLSVVVIYGCEEWQLFVHVVETLQKSVVISHIDSTYHYNSDFINQNALTELEL